VYTTLLLDMGAGQTFVNLMLLDLGPETSAYIPRLAEKWEDTPVRQE
jgi:hypothetical protein